MTPTRATVLLALAALVPASDESGLVEPEARLVHEWRGEAAGEQFGWVAQDAGDLDGDGVHDVLTSAPFRAPGGRVLAFSGADGALLHEVRTGAGEQVGRSVCGVGDVDGDGHDDFAAGAPAAASGTGRAYVWSGATGEVLHTLEGLEPGGSFGAAVTGLGDFDGDGRGDLAVSSPAAGPGLVFGYSGADGSELFVLEGERDGDRFGSALGAGGAGDALTLVVGAKDAGEGRRGRALVHRFEGDAPEVAFAIEALASGVDLGQYFVSVLGDVDADGVLDVYAADFSDGAAADSGRPGGRIYVHSGADGARLFERGALHRGEGFGIGDARVGDVDGDGHADLLVGAWTNDQGGAAAGKAYLLSGANRSVLREITSATAGEAFGFDATGIADLDGDGATDFLLTGAYHPAAGVKTGRVVVVSGALD